MREGSSQTCSLKRTPSMNSVFVLRDNFAKMKRRMMFFALLLQCDCSIVLSPSLASSLGVLF